MSEPAKIIISAFMTHVNPFFAFFQNIFGLEYGIVLATMYK